MHGGLSRRGDLMTFILLVQELMTEVEASARSRTTQKCKYEVAAGTRDLDTGLRKFATVFCSFLARAPCILRASGLLVLLRSISHLGLAPT